MKTPIILHADDDKLMDELAGTTEIEGPTGRVMYYPPIKNQDHRTDSIRSVIRALDTIEAEDEGYDTFSFGDEYGFMNVEDDEYEYP